jgi:hypothetical protein
MVEVIPSFSMLAAERSVTSAGTDSQLGNDRSVTPGIRMKNFPSNLEMNF